MAAKPQRPPPGNPPTHHSQHQLVDVRVEDLSIWHSTARVVVLMQLQVVQGMRARPEPLRQLLHGAHDLHARLARIAVLRGAQHVDQALVPPLHARVILGLHGGTQHFGNLGIRCGDDFYRRDAQPDHQGYHADADDGLWICNRAQDLQLADDRGGGTACLRRRVGGTIIVT